MGKHKGIKLVAHLPVSKTTVLDVGTQPDTGGAKFLKLLKKSFLVRQGYLDDQNDEFFVDFHVHGKGFKYEKLFPGSPQVPIEGKIKAVDTFVDGELGLELSKLNLSVPDAAKLWAKDDPLAAFAKLLVGDDTIIGSPFDDPLLWGGRGNDLMWGRGGSDIVNGFKGNDVNDGGPGNDKLVDTKGSDTFQFSTPILTGAGNLNFNFDTITKFGAGDEIYLKYSIFPAAGMEVSKGELAFTEQAQDGNDFFLFFAGIFSYDDDANGPHPATPVFQITDFNILFTHKMIEIGAHGDFY